MSANSKSNVSIIGLGYVGLPLAVLAQEKGWQVIGIDIDQAKIDLINGGEVPFKDDELAAQLKKYPISATRDFSSVSQSDVVVIAVPTPVNSAHEPDLTPVTSAIESLLPHLKNGQVLIVESTINPGVMEEVVTPLISQRDDLNLETESSSGPVFGLVHCPERINPGDPNWTVRNIPRVLGGFGKQGTAQAEAFYGSILEAPVKVLDSATEAEAVKILENTFRDINIAYINEMAKSFDALGINISNVIDGAATKPFAFMPHYPGNGVGGHCISVDPYYMIERGRQAGFDHKFLKLAREINESMPAFSVQLLELGLQKLGLELNKTPVAVLGLAYKKNVADTRNSPAYKSIDLLKSKTDQISIFDPYVPEESTVSSLSEALASATVVMLACDHDELVAGLTVEQLTASNVQLIIDGKNALDPNQFSNSSTHYLGIGRPNTT